MCLNRNWIWTTDFFSIYHIHHWGPDFAGPWSWHAIKILLIIILRWPVHRLKCILWLMNTQKGLLSGSSSQASHKLDFFSTQNNQIILNWSIPLKMKLKRINLLFLFAVVNIFLPLFAINHICFILYFLHFELLLVIYTMRCCNIWQKWRV